MTRTTHNADRTRRKEILALIGSIVAGAVSGAVRALTTWLLDR
ncbi:hypothetical protein [Streptomyces xantholiticus]|nr:hypothetical protein [Streptomyces xantholiticus]GGW72541.1 hypothetical protein GCM10010381_66580 [Streptomyces xantholiticus]